MANIGPPQEALNVHANFQTFPTAFLTLLRCATGENWDMIMFDLSRTRQIDFECRYNETYETIQANGGIPFACGSQATSIIFFILFQLICSQVVLNLFIAIIVEAFLGTAEMFSSPIQLYHVEEFVNIWRKYDPAATGLITLSDLDHLILDMARSEDGSTLIVVS